MAFLVFYARSPAADHSYDPRDRAASLDQRFYEMIYRRCRSEPGPFDVLREVGLLRYKSPTLFIPTDRMAVLAAELAILAAAGESHPQITEFRLVCNEAIARRWGLTISGDMYPELWREEAQLPNGF